MRRSKQKISYDKDSHVLVIEMKKGKSVDSDVHDNLVIDYDDRGDVVRVNLYDFCLTPRHTKVLKQFSSGITSPHLVR